MNKNIKYIILVTFLLFSLNPFLNAQTYCAGDSILLNAQAYISGDVQWQNSSDHVIWTNIQGANALTCMIYPVSSAYYRILITDSNCLSPYSSNAQYIFITPEPTAAYAGIDQTNIQGSATTLNGNTAIYGVGTWSIISGIGGIINDIHDPQSSFSGISGNSYVLQWTIENGCGSTSDAVSINFALFTCGNLLTDIRDGQLYPTVLIGSQCWMAKNLNIGQQISGTLAQSNNLIIEKYCYGDTIGSCNLYGGMYQWDEMMQYSSTESIQGICPEGWHLPSDNEWKVLEMALGMTQTEADMGNTWRGANVGTALKAGGSSGFNALLGGGRWSNAAFMYVNQMGYFWTSTQSGSNAWRRCLSATDHLVGRWDSFSKIFGFSVRCLKN
ncbi:MAG: fibrobacter succinogenes major paralogous domain-containing protein [Bacteroidales bacterium]|nr:fibrobacter succinogenes major paralogous domain-containing protein [Bacteroidales bacterium]